MKVTVVVRVAAALVLGALVADGASQASAQSISCGGTYVVVPGDTLSEIAARAYTNAGFQTIFDANRNVLTSPSRLEVGDRLFIPCLDAAGNPLPRGQVAALPAPAAPAAPSEAAPAEAAPAEAALRQLVPDPGTGPEFQPAPGAAAISDIPAGSVVRLYALAQSAPFAGERLPEGGMLTEIIQRALLRAPVPIDYEVTFGDGSSVGAPSQIAARGADIGFPVLRPDCANPAALGAAERDLCDDYLFSAPVYDFAMGTFVLAAGDFTGASEPAALFGTRLCRPAGASTADLARVGLVAPNINPVEAASTAECFLLLANGDVNVVSVPVTEGLAAIRDLGLGSKVTQAAVASGSSPMHAISPRSNPLAGAYIALVDRGLAEMRGSGEYEAVIDNHLAFASRTN